MPEAVLEAPERPARVPSRSGRLALGGAALGASRAGAALLGVALTALLARRLGPSEFGLWAVLTALPALAAHLDLGMGNALRNRLAALAPHEGKDEAARVSFMATFSVFAACAAAVAALAFAVGPFLPWASLLPHETVPFLNIASRATVLSVAFLAFNVAFGVGGFGFYAYQETHLAAGFDLLRSAFALLFTAGAMWLGADLVGVLGAYVAGQTLSSALGWATFVRRRGWTPSLPTETQVRRTVGELGKASLQFTVLQLSAAVINYTDGMIVGRVAGLGAAGDYALVQKLFLVLMSVQFFLLTPLWSAYTNAEASGERAWTRKALDRSLWFTALVNGAGSAFLAWAGPWLVLAWTGKTVGQPWLFASMAVWAFVYGFSSCFSVLLNAVGRLKRQTALAAFGAVINVPLALWLGARFGAVGVCWAGLISMLPVACSNPLEAFGYLRED